MKSNNNQNWIPYYQEDRCYKSIFKLQAVKGKATEKGVHFLPTFSKVTKKCFLVQWNFFYQRFSISKFKLEGTFQWELTYSSSFYFFTINYNKNLIYILLKLVQSTVKNASLLCIASQIFIKTLLFFSIKKKKNHKLPRFLCLKNR